MLKKTTIISLIVVLSFLVLSTVVLANDTAGSRTAGEGAYLTNPLSVKDPRLLIANIINAILGLVGSLALVVFIYGGFLWLTSGGNEQMIAKGKNLMIWAALGIAVIFTSYAIVRFIIEAVGGL